MWTPITINIEEEILDDARIEYSGPWRPKLRGRWRSGEAYR